MRKSTTPIYLGVCLILCGALLPLIAYVACYFTPRKYISKVTIEPKSQQMMVISPPEKTEPRYFVDQMEILQSKPILYAAIDDLKLVEKWSAGLPARLAREEVYKKFFKMIKVSQRADTDFLEVTVTSTDRQEAAEIANTIAVEYKKKRRDDLDQQITKTLSKPNMEVEQQRLKMEAAKTGVERIRTRDKIQDLDPDKAGAPVTPANAEYETAKQNYIKAKGLLEQGETAIETEKMDMQMELAPPKIWERAEPAINPSSPDVRHITLVACGLGFLCIFCGAVLVFVGLRLKQAEALPPA